MGIVPISAEWTSAVVLLSIAAAMFFLQDRLSTAWREVTANALAEVSRGTELGGALVSGASAAFVAIAPILGVAVIAAVLATVAQIGPLFAWRALGPNSENFSPEQGSRLAEFAGSLLSLSVHLAITVGVLYHELPGIIGLALRSPADAIGHLCRLILVTLFFLGAAHFFLSLFDIAYQRFRHRRAFQLTPSELRQELREAEGDPALRRHRLRIHRSDVSPPGDSP